MTRPKFSADLSIQTGDLVGYSGRGLLSDFINVVTYGVPRWGISHVGMVVVEDDVPYVVEALNSRNEVIKRPLAASLNCPAWLYPVYRKLYSHEAQRISDILNDKVGIPYDIIGAFWSGGVLTRLLGSAHRTECAAQLFCSELAAYAWSEAGLFVTADYSSWSPNALVRRARFRGVIEKPIRLPLCVTS